MATILVLVENAGMVRRVRVGLAEYRLLDAVTHPIDDTTVDLILTDGHGLRDHQKSIEAALSAAYPVFLPLMVMLEPGGSVSAGSRLGAFDVVHAPFEAAQLRARINNLLHLRGLSQVQQQNVARADARLEGAHRALRTLSACNELAMRASDEAELLDRACRMIVSEGGYMAAWVGYADDNPEKTVSVQAHAGGLEDYIRAMGVTWGPEPSGQGPFGRAVRSGQPAMSTDVGTDPDFAPWCDLALRHGLGSVIALPLRTGRRPFGALAIYAAETHAFAPRERELLMRAANSLAYGVQVLRERAENVRSQERITRLAYCDQLTGLPNRSGLTMALAEMLRGRDGEVRGGAVLFIDLDGFKLINDALGHRTGDRVLVQVAERLQGIVRSHDQVGRQGGDEFIILVPYIPRLDGQDEAVPNVDRLSRMAVDMAERVIAALQVPFVIQGGERYLSASIGISLFPRDAGSVPRLVSQADSAMYHAKARGGGRYAFYSPALSRARKRRLSLETQLHKAVEHGEFQLYYQPIVGLRDRRVHSIEALLRWPRPEGTAHPDEFVPILEETGLIVPVGEWVMREACNALQGLTPLAPDLRVSINLSVNQLWQPELVNRLAQTLDAVAPQRIELEITEGAMARGPDRAERNVRALCDCGFRIAIDDFGTGYSSLDRLRYLPISTIKVDKRFLSNAPADRDSAVLVTSIVQLGHDLGLRIVAEGVETEAQRRFLQELDCEDGQGFLFGSARPLASIRRLLESAGAISAG